MGRVLSTAFCVALLAAAAAAFALTEGAKTELSPVYGTQIAKIFSPTCDPHICGSRVAPIVFKLRRRHAIDLWVTNAATGARVSTIVTDRSYARGIVRLAFTGHSASGALLPDGSYVPVLRLIGDLTLTFPNVIVLETHPPHVVHAPHGATWRLDPGSSNEPQEVKVAYSLSAKGYGVLYANGRRVGLTYRQPLVGDLVWTGLIDHQLVPAGRYTLSLAVRDAAGNQSRPIAVGVVTVSYLTVGVRALTVGRHKPFTVPIAIGPAHLTWSFAGHTGSASSHTLQLLAPKRRGRYRLVVRGGGHVATVLVTVG